jgi:hypothetical protein
MGRSAVQKYVGVKVMISGNRSFQDKRRLINTKEAGSSFYYVTTLLYAAARSDRNRRDQTKYPAHLYDRLPRASVNNDVLTVDTDRSGTAEKDCDVGDLGRRSDVGIKFGSDRLALFDEDLHGRACRLHSELE